MNQTSLDNIDEANFTPYGEEVTVMYVFVLDQNKNPLDPCHPARARELLNTLAAYDRFQYENQMKGKLL